MNTIITSLSDQQLVLGMSILVAGLARYHEINTYSINIVIDLAYLAVHIHLVSVILAEHPIGKHYFLKSARTFVMTSDMIMLLFLMTLQLSWAIRDEAYQYLSLECALQHYRDVNWSSKSAGSIISYIIVVLDLVSKYATALSVLWIGNRDDPLIVVPDFLSSRHGMTAEDVRELVHKHEIARFEKAQQAGGTPSRFRMLRLAESWAFHYSRGTIEWELIWYSFFLTYGTSRDHP